MKVISACDLVLKLLLTTKENEKTGEDSKECMNVHSLPFPGMFMETHIWPKSSVGRIANHVIYGLQQVYHAEVLNTGK